MKKEPTAAQLEARRKFGEAAKERAAKKRAEKEIQIVQEDEVVAAPNPDMSDVNQLMKRIEELEARQFFAQPQQPQIMSRSVTKFSTNAKDYPDPRPRLFDEERLKMKNFTPTWWALEWKVGKVDYDRDSVHYTEPRFEIELWHIMEDDAGEPSNRRYKVCVGMFFEDPDSFIQVANLKELEIPEQLQQEFMDEMRYLVVRDWLLECFYPPKPTTKGTNRTETVIGNRVVEVVEINSADAVNAFDKLVSKA